MSPGQSNGLESELPSEELPEAPVSLEKPEGPVTLEKLYGIIAKQNNAILLLTGKMAETSQGLVTLEEHQDQTDAAIIEVAKKVGGGGGGGGGKGANLLAQILPYLRESRGPSPLEKIANQMFIRNIAFTSLTTERLAKKQFGEEYANMVKEMEADLSGTKES